MWTLLVWLRIGAGVFSVAFLIKRDLDASESHTNVFQRFGRKE
jgi:hypothetical protein